MNSSDELVRGLVGWRLDDALEALGLDARRVDRAEAHVPVHLLAQRVEDAGGDDLDAEDVLGDLRGHDVAVVAARRADEGVGVADVDLLEHVDVDAVADVGRAAEVVGQEAERGGVDVEDEDVVAFAAQLGRQCGADAAAAHDHDLHLRSHPWRGYSRTGWRQSQTLHGAARRTYCVRRPIWYSPSGALCSAPMRIRSTPRSIASSTMAWPASRACSSSPSILQSASAATRSARDAARPRRSSPRRELGIERQRALHFDDVDRVDLALVLLGDGAGEGTASMLAGEPSTGTRMDRTPAMGSVAAKVLRYSAGRGRTSCARASRHYRNGPMLPAMNAGLSRSAVCARRCEASVPRVKHGCAREVSSGTISSGLPGGALRAVFQRDVQPGEAVADAVGELPLLGGAQLGADLDQQVDERRGLDRPFLHRFEAEAEHVGQLEEQRLRGRRTPRPSSRARLISFARSKRTASACGVLRSSSMRGDEALAERREVDAAVAIAPGARGRRCAGGRRPASRPRACLR